MVMQRLRDETAELHAQVEDLMDPDARFATRASYIGLLHLLQPFYLKCETVLESLPWQQIGFDFESRRKEPLLVADLAALGEAVNGEKPDSHCPICIDLASGFGTLYVLEGATLGGRILRKSLKSKLDIDADNGGSFYNGYGNLTQQRWQEFGIAAEAYCAGYPQRIDSALAAATATFTAFGRLLSSPDGSFQ
jgi:heme oxygenase